MCFRMEECISPFCVSATRPPESRLLIWNPPAQRMRGGVTLGRTWVLRDTQKRDAWYCSCCRFVPKEESWEDGMNFRSYDSQGERR
jgi:hypothetical protein